MSDLDRSTVLTSPDDWTAAACAPLSGAGTLARRGPILLLAADADDAVVVALVDHAQMVAANGGQARQLVRGLALQLASLPDDAPPAFAALAPVADGLAVFVSGSASVTVDGAEISARDSLAWVERRIPWPIGQVSARVDGTAAAGSAILDLRDGVVRAGGFSLTATTPDQSEPTEPVEPAAAPADAAAAPVEPAAAPTPAPAEAVPAAAPTPAAPDVSTPWAEAAVEAERPVADASPGAFESIVLVNLPAEADEPPTPLPIIESRRDVAAASDADESHVRGVFCKNHHFNDPRMLFCAVCGINMVQQTPVLVDGTRPPLGVIVLDDGSVFQLDANYLLGREPEPDDLVRSGRYRGIAMTDQANLISRVHARLDLRHWDVVLVDNASTNGTFFAEPGSPSWRKLPRSGEQTLAPGTRVRIGNRTLAFNTHRGG